MSQLSAPFGSIQEICWSGKGWQRGSVYPVNTFSLRMSVSFVPGFVEAASFASLHLPQILKMNPEAAQPHWSHFVTDVSRTMVDAVSAGPAFCCNMVASNLLHGNADETRHGSPGNSSVLLTSCFSALVVCRLSSWPLPAPIPPCPSASRFSLWKTVVFFGDTS